MDPVFTMGKGIRYSSMALGYPTFAYPVPGPLVYLKLLGERVLVINSYDVAVDLLEKRSQIYSNRPKLWMAGELVGWSRAVTLAPSGERHRRYRRLLHSALSTSAVSSVFPLLESEAKKLLRNLLNNPADFAAHIRRNVEQTIVRVSYGHDGADGKDYIALSEDAQHKFSLAATPYTYLVDYVPLLRYVPSWFPGAKFIRDARQWRTELEYLVMKPVNVVKEQLSAGNASTSYVSQHLDEGADEEDVAWSAVSLFTGGADTTVSSILTFFLAMCLYPHVQKRAQAEIDAVLLREGEALPKLTHRHMLPYVEACVAEVFRWQPVIPLGVAHQLTQDDEYCGYHIPAGTTIIANTWAMTRDCARFPNPETFDPERYLGTSAHQEGFGFGRRVCPGRWLADASVFIAIASVLAKFNILSPLDEKGFEVLPPLSYSTGLISHPAPFRCRIVLRGDAAGMDQD